MDARSDALPRFVSRIFETPALRALPALQREEQALQFLKINGSQLQPLLASMGIAAAAGWRETVAGLVREIRSLADRLLEGEIARAIDRRLLFAFYPALGSGRQPPAKARDELGALCRRGANHPVSRRALAGSLSAVLSDLTDKYIPQIWERRKYTCVEVTLVQRLSVKAGECADLLRLEAADYLFRQRGWIDFLASIPLLLFNSLPNALALLAGAGLVTGLGSFLNVLKVIKAVRIARILRLMRVVKLFRRIRYVRSPMAQRHIAIITTISVTVLVMWVLLANLLGSLGILPGLGSSFLAEQSAHARHLSQAGSDPSGIAARARALAALDSSLLVVRPQGQATSWTRYDDAYSSDHFLAGDYQYFNEKGVESFFDDRPVSLAVAKEGIVFFVAILLSVLAYLLLYSPRFALGVTDPIHVMKRGMEESGYNLAVKIPARHADDDVFELARLSNSVFLPLKDRGNSQGEQAPALGIDDIRSFVEKEW